MDGAAHLRSIEVLLVEDSPSDRLLTLEALSSANVLNAVSVVENGAEAMDYLRRKGKYTDARRPDLVLLDLNLPKKDGREVLAEMKTDPLLRSIPVVVLTTSGARDDVEHAYHNYANSYIQKPVDFAQFAGALKSLGGFWFEVVSLPLEARDSVPGRPAVWATPDAAPQEKLRVLLIEDMASDALIIRAALSASNTVRFDVTHTTRLAEAEQLLRQRAFDLVITDLGLPDSQGLETVRRIRQLGVDAPLVVLTGLDDDETGVRALDEGAHDYLVKGQLTPRAVARAARYAIDKRLQQEQLRQSQKLEAIGRLAAGIAHDFNNVLGIVRGNAELLGQASSLAEVHEASVEILEATDRAMGLARQLLTFSRPQTMHARAVDLGTTVGDFSRMLRRLLGQGIHLDLRLASTLPVVMADAGMIEQVLLNLVVNARDAMAGNGRLTIETARVEAPPHSAAGAGGGQLVRLSVKDTGHGMSAEVCERIFEPFFTTKPRDEGTGLGLAMVQRIVQQHDGFVEVRSSVGVGTTFDVFLPIAQAAPESIPPPALAPPGGGETILVVDDEAQLRNLAARMLRRHGYRVLTAASAAEARILWLEQRADVSLVLTDLVLPDRETGLRLAESLVAKSPGLKVVFMSGYSPDYGAEGPLLEHGVNFLQKPFALAQLLDCVRRRLDAPSSDALT